MCCCCRVKSEMVLDVAGHILRFLIYVELPGTAFRLRLCPLGRPRPCGCRDRSLPTTISLLAVFAPVVTDFLYSSSRRKRATTQFSRHCKHGIKMGGFRFFTKVALKTAKHKTKPVFQIGHNELFPFY